MAPSLPSTSTSTPTSSSASTMAVSPLLPVYGVAPPDIPSLPHVCPGSSLLQPFHHSHLHPSSLPSSTARAPVPLLSLAEFGRMHLEQATVHPPDSVLFPFLHGLEGNNDAQCSFFASTPSTAASAAAGLDQDTAGRVIRPPRYRGLVWVLCDEDIQGDLPQICTAPTRWDDDLACDSDSSDYSTDQAEPDHDFEFDGPAAEPSQHPRQLYPAVPTLPQPDPCTMDVDAPPANPSEEAHMHPLALRITTVDHLHHLSHDRRHSNASSSDSASTDGSSSTNSGSGSTSATSLPSPLFSPSPSCAAYPNTSEEDPLLLDAHSSGIPSDSHSEAQVIQDPQKPACPPILTSTFLPAQLIQPCQTAPDNVTLRKDDWLESTNWEFKPAIVPDGISLRNFGIQVPLYTSISDIVVYSPRGPSPAALRLAARFRRAVEKKRSERLDRWVRTRGESARSEKEDPYVTPEGFLKYGVYVLDADADAIKQEIPWMIMQREGECDRMCANETFPQPEGCYTPSGCSGRCTSTPGGCWRSDHGQESVAPTKQARDPEIEPEVLDTESAAQVPEEREESLSPPRPTYTRSRSHTHPYHPRDGQRSHRERQPTTDTVQSPANGSTCTPPPPRPTIIQQDSTSAPVNHHSCTQSPLGHLAHTSHNHRHELHRCKRTNTIDFARREKEEMRDLTRASEIITVWGMGDESDHVHSSKATPATCWDPHAGQVFLGNSNDVPVWPPPSKRKRRPANRLCDTNASSFPRNHHMHHESFMDDLERSSPFESEANSPSLGRGFDICIECHEYAPLPSTAHLRAVEEHVRALEMEWVEQWQRAAANGENMDVDKDKIPPRPPPHPAAIVHLPFPSSQHAMPSMLSSLIPLIRFLEKLITPSRLGGGDHANGIRAGTPGTPPKGIRLPSPWSLRSSHGNGHENGGSVHANGNGNGCGIPASTFPPEHRPRPLKLLLYSSDGYTESSVPALCLLMAVKGISLPEAYLEMQVVKRRSFFVYQAEVALLKKVEARLGVGNGQGYSRLHGFGYRDIHRGLVAPPGPFMAVPVEDPHSGSNLCLRPLMLGTPPVSGPSGMRSATAPIAHMLGVAAEEAVKLPSQSLLRRPRASTLPSFIPDHQSWFDDARFDGSFPSRVLPFLYLGNLNHASNAYMLHALGITHVVSVGECALVPPPQMDSTAGDVAPVCPIQWQCIPGQGPSSLWIEEREGRIKVLNIEGVCDDGIDTLEHQLHPICTWIEKARQAGGQVLVHCRVGVSRSATVTIAYVMQHLGLSLVEAYLVVRSRRLSVLIQPNMRLLYNLLGWEVRLARERAGGDERRLREVLTKALSWPYLAREVHALNEKYLG